MQACAMGCSVDQQVLLILWGHCSARYVQNYPQFLHGCGCWHCREKLLLPGKTARAIASKDWTPGAAT